MTNTLQTYADNINRIWWKSTLPPPQTTEQETNTNAALDVIHKNNLLSRDEKLALGRQILAQAQEPQPEPATSSKANDTKSKVCLISNRLSKQGVNRSEAFRKAWATVKAASFDGLEVKAAGVTIGNRQTALEHLTRYEPEQISVSLDREPANEFDQNAITVTVTVQNKGSFLVGYIPRILAAILAPLIDAHKTVTATFKEIRGKLHNYHNYGLALIVSI